VGRPGHGDGQPCWLHAFGDARLVRKKFEDFCDVFDTQGFVPPWAPGHSAVARMIPAHDLWFPTGCWEYLLVTDDREFAPRLLAASEAVLAWFEEHRDGELYSDTGGWKWTEWNFQSAETICTWENLLAVAAWRAVARLRRYLERPGADTAEQRANALATAVVARLWHAGHGR